MIAVVGDGIFDSWTYTQLDAFKRRPTRRVTDKFITPGGAANVYDNICSIFSWAVKEEGRALTDEQIRKTVLDNTTLAINGRKDCWLIPGFYYRWKPIEISKTMEVRILENSNAAVKYRTVDSNSGNILLYASDDDFARTASSQGYAQALFDALLINIEAGDISIVVVSDYDKGYLTPERRRQLIKTCNNCGVTVLVDTAPVNYEFYKGAFLVKPNFTEFIELSKTCEVPGDFESVSDEICNRYGFSYLVNTRNSYEVLVASADRTCPFNQIGVEALRCSDSAYVGAGDAFMAMLAVSLYCGDELFTAAYNATRYATEYCGCAPVHLPKFIKLSDLSNLNK